MHSGNLAQSADCTVAVQSADCAATVSMVCALERYLQRKQRELSRFYSVVLCEKLGGHFGSRESSSSQQPFIPCEQTCHCFPQLQARKRTITIVKKDRGYFPLGEVVLSRS